MAAFPPETLGIRSMIQVHRAIRLGPVLRPEDLLTGHAILILLQRVLRL